MVRSTWSAGACRTVAGASFEGSLKKISKCPVKSSLEMTEKITFSRGLIVRVLLLTIIVKHPVGDAITGVTNRKG